MADLTADDLTAEVAEVLGWEHADFPVYAAVEVILERFTLTRRSPVGPATEAPVGPRDKLRPDGFPTRNDVLLMTPAEQHIWRAVSLVEALGASPSLTEAVVLLGRARELVADHVEAPR